MDNSTHIITNNGNVIGFLYNSKKFNCKVFTTTGEPIDLNQDLEIYDCEKQEIINNLDLKDAILEVFPNLIIEKCK